MIHITQISKKKKKWMSNIPKKNAQEAINGPLASTPKKKTLPNNLMERTKEAQNMSNALQFKY